MPLSTRLLIRPAEDYSPDYYLLDEIRRPNASVNGSRISIWIYRDGWMIREIVLCGHAESTTCRRATTIVIETVKALDGVMQWMLTCGACFIRPSDNASGEQLLAAQPILQEMHRRFADLGNTSGLVQLLVVDWHFLDHFRAEFRKAGRRKRTIIVPSVGSENSLADFLSIIPIRRSDGRPVKFKLEGWDYDCPEFQAVADRHLRRLHRELLRDALRRRRIYRSWLKDWVTRWVVGSQVLPREEAENLQVGVPAPLPDQEDDFIEQSPQSQKIRQFLVQSAGRFLDRDQVWHRELAEAFGQLIFGQLEDAELNKQIHPDRILEIDFERGVERERPTTSEDHSFTTREKLQSREPEMISICLRYIQRMDFIIGPYETSQWKSRRAAGAEFRSKRARETALVDRISRQIVIETMVRGWPSIYLEDEQDRVMFDRWATNQRTRIWQVMAKQARSFGVAPEILLEDNVVYDVQFDDDLGCSLQPLMVCDNTSHFQAHGTRAGASLSLPLWKHRETSPLPVEAMELGGDNRERAKALINNARQLSTQADCDIDAVAQLLRTGLACHPPEAGRQILKEWASRVGRDTSREFASAAKIVRASELARTGRINEAKSEAEQYLAEAQDAVPDAWVISGLSELPYPDHDRELRDLAKHSAVLIEKYNEMLPAVRQIQERAHLHTAAEALLPGFPSELQAFLLSRLTSRMVLDDRSAKMLEEFNRIKDELDRATVRFEGAKAEVEEAEAKRIRLIKAAIDNPAGVKKHYPKLALAGRRAPEQLKAMLSHEGRYVQWSEAMFQRYGDTAKTVEILGLLEVHELISGLYNLLDEDAKKIRTRVVDSLGGLLQVCWLSHQVRTDLSHLHEDMIKGDWDRLHGNQMQSLLQTCAEAVLMRIRDLITDPVVIGAPLAETILMKFYVAQTLDACYQTAYSMLLEATVPLARAFSSPWIICTTSLVELPAGAVFRFEPDTGTVAVCEPGKSISLLRLSSMTIDDAAYASRVICDPELPSRVNRFASSLADGLLAVQVEPCPDWIRWRDAIASLRPELLSVLALFPNEVTFFPDYAPRLTEAGEQSLIRMNKLIPRDFPKFPELASLQPWSNWIGPITETFFPD
jgi:hypothetical protein